MSTHNCVYVETGRKGAKGFFKKGAWNQRLVLLGKIEINGNELGAKKA